MQYKDLFKRTYQLIISSRTEWEKITSSEDTSSKVINDFVLPLAGLCSLSAFLGIIFINAEFERALVAAIISLGKSFGGVYLSFFVLQETAKYFDLKRNKTRYMQLVGYSYVIIFIVDIIVNLIPELFFLNFLKLYIFYIIWEGVDFCTKISEEKRIKLVIGTTILILASSLIIEKLLFKFMPGAEIIAG